MSIRFTAFLALTMLLLAACGSGGGGGSAGPTGGGGTPGGGGGGGTLPASGTRFVAIDDGSGNGTLGDTAWRAYAGIGSDQPSVALNPVFAPWTGTPEGAGFRVIKQVNDTEDTVEVARSVDLLTIVVAGTPTSETAVVDESRDDVPQPTETYTATIVAAPDTRPIAGLYRGTITRTEGDGEFGLGDQVWCTVSADGQCTFDGDDGDGSLALAFATGGGLYGQTSDETGSERVSLTHNGTALTAGTWSWTPNGGSRILYDLSFVRSTDSQAKTLETFIVVSNEPKKLVGELLFPIGEGDPVAVSYSATQMTMSITLGGVVHEVPIRYATGFDFGNHAIGGSKGFYLTSGPHAGTWVQQMVQLALNEDGTVDSGTYLVIGQDEHLEEIILDWALLR